MYSQYEHDYNTVFLITFFDGLLTNGYCFETIFIYLFYQVKEGNSPLKRALSLCLL